MATVYGPSRCSRDRHTLDDATHTTRVKKTIALAKAIAQYEKTDIHLINMNTEINQLKAALHLASIVTQGLKLSLENENPQSTALQNKTKAAIFAIDHANTTAKEWAEDPFNDRKHKKASEAIAIACKLTALAELSHQRLKYPPT